MIKTVTFTGADDTTDISRMIYLSKKYPFVEWAILVMPGRYGKPRWPSIDWIIGLCREDHMDMNLSLHLCGDYVDQILNGDADLIIGLSQIWAYFRRVQINTHGILSVFNRQRMSQLMTLFPAKEYIFQFDDVNQAVFAAAEDKINCSALFDLSHGAGMLPARWPDLLPEIKCGYAGGISPENIVHQIKLIEGKAGDTPIWIDMETHVRSFKNGVDIFDLDKVETCLKLSEPFVK